MCMCVSIGPKFCNELMKNFPAHINLLPSYHDSSISDVINVDLRKLVPFDEHYSNT